MAECSLLKQGARERWEPGCGLRPSQLWPELWLGAGRTLEHHRIVLTWRRGHWGLYPFGYVIGCGCWEWAEAHILPMEPAPFTRQVPAGARSGDVCAMLVSTCAPCCRLVPWWAPSASTRGRACSMSTQAHGRAQIPTRQRREWARMSEHNAHTCSWSPPDAQVLHSLSACLPWSLLCPVLSSFLSMHLNFGPRTRPPSIQE